MFNGYGYFYVRLYCTCLGAEVLLQPSSAAEETIGFSDKSFQLLQGFRVVAVVQPRFFSHFREVQQYFSELGLPKGMLEILPGITQARVVAQGGLCASILEIVRDTISITIHNLIKEMYDWSGWHVGTGSRMLSCTAEARVEGRRHSHHPLHHQQGDGRVRAVLGRFTLPSTTFHRHPHCTCVTQRAPNTGTSHIRPEVVGWAPPV